MTKLYRFSGDGEQIRLFGDVELDEVELEYPISVDRTNQQPWARTSTPVALGDLAFRWQKGTKDSVFLDCHMVFSSETPFFFCEGFVSVVSEKARDVLLPELGAEASFVETTIRGCEGRYFVFWITCISDPIDVPSNQLKPGYLGDGRFRLPRFPDYDLDKVKSKYVFRLPAWKYELNRDFATSEFFGLVKRAGLTGFGFRDV